MSNEVCMHLHTLHITVSHSVQLWITKLNLLNYFQVAFEGGTSTSYALASSQDRGQLFIGHGVDVYKGQIVGIHQRPGDLSLNVCKKKAATNIRSNKEQSGDKQLQSYSTLSCILLIFYHFVCFGYIHPQF